MWASASYWVVSVTTKIMSLLFILWKCMYFWQQSKRRILLHYRYHHSHQSGDRCYGYKGCDLCSGSGSIPENGNRSRYGSDKPFILARCLHSGTYYRRSTVWCTPTGRPSLPLCYTSSRVFDRHEYRTRVSTMGPSHRLNILPRQDNAYASLVIMCPT